MFNRASCLTLSLWFLFQYESVSKPSVTNVQSEYNDLFSSRCSKSWSPFSQDGLNLEKFIMDVRVPSLLPFLSRNLLIIGFKSVHGMEITLGLRSKVDLAAESALSFALSFPLTPNPTQNYFLWLDIESSLPRSLTINGFSSFLFSRDVNTESESENMINLLCLSLEMMLRARSIAHTSAVKIELSIGRAFLWIILFRTAAHAILLWSFEPSVKTLLKFTLVSNNSGAKGYLPESIFSRGELPALRLLFF